MLYMWQCTECRIFLPCNDIELLIFVWSLQASAALSCAKLELFCVFFLEPSGHSIVYIFLEPAIVPSI